MRNIEGRRKFRVRMKLFLFILRRFYLWISNKRCFLVLKIWGLWEGFGVEVEKWELVGRRWWLELKVKMRFFREGSRKRR